MITIRESYSLFMYIYHLMVVELHGFQHVMFRYVVIIIHDTLKLPAFEVRKRTGFLLLLLNLLSSFLGINQGVLIRSRICP